MNENDKLLAWGNSNDGSQAGLVYHETAEGEPRIYLGSVGLATTQKSDMRSITQWGNKVSAKELREWADMIDPPKKRKK